MKQHDIIFVAIVEDEDDIRQSLQIIIDGTAGFRCVGAYRDCETALDAIGEQLPDVLLMDIALPGISGIEGVRRIKAILPELDIMMLTVHGENELIFQSLRAGACGYLLKNTPAIELLESIREVYNGGAPMSTRIARMVIASFQNSSGGAALTVRQKEVLRLLMAGHSHKMIAEELHLSLNTVKSHIKNIYKLLHVHSQPEAIAKVVRHKLL